MDSVVGTSLLVGIVLRDGREEGLLLCEGTGDTEGKLVNPPLLGMSEVSVGMCVNDGCMLSDGT